MRIITATILALVLCLTATLAYADTLYLPVIANPFGITLLWWRGGYYAPDRSYILFTEIKNDTLAEICNVKMDVTFANAPPATGYSKKARIAVGEKSYLHVVTQGTEPNILPLSFALASKLCQTLTPTPIPATTATPTLTPTPTSTPTPTITPTPTPECHPSYVAVCIPYRPGDALNCDSPELEGAANFPVLPPDPYNLDADNDGIGCESP